MSALASPTRGRSVDAVGVADDAVLRPLDDLDFADLRLDLAGPEAAVDDADPALLGLDDGHRRAGDRVHVGRDDRALQRDPAGQSAGQIDGRRVPARQHASLWCENIVIEGAPLHAVEDGSPDGRIDDRKHGVIGTLAIHRLEIMPSPLRHLERSLRVRLAETLPGVQAQLKFAPTPPRPDWRAGHFPPDTRTAAALLLLYPRENDVAIPLTIRASGLARHAGQISLPGGATDEGETLSEAALREAAEEVGVDPASVRILGELTPVHVVVSGFTLHPIIGVTDERPAFVAAPGEVDEILEVSLDDLRDASRIGRDIRIREGVAVEWPYFDLLGHQVWGATAMVLGEFICLI